MSYLTIAFFLSIIVLIFLLGFAIGIRWQKTKYQKNKPDNKKDLADQNNHLFLAKISHELRNPLNVIIGYSEIMEKEKFGSLNKKYKEYLQDIISSGRHLLLIFESILDISRLESKKWLPQESFFDPEVLLTQLKRDHQKKAEKEGVVINISYKLEAGSSIFADKVAIRQILSNLLNNAIKHCPRTGICKIELKKNDKDIVFEISDSGKGFSKEDSKVALIPFGRGGKWRENTGNTGLGIPIAAGLAELHGGHLEISDGSLVKIFLPISRLKFSQT